MMVVVVVVASLAWSVYTTAVSPTTAYFSTLARAWELAAGGGCALLVARGALPAERERATREVLGLCGLLAVIGSALVLDAKTPFPGMGRPSRRPAPRGGLTGGSGPRRSLASPARIASKAVHATPIAPLARLGRRSRLTPTV